VLDLYVKYTDCKSVYAGSILTPASKSFKFAWARPIALLPHCVREKGGDEGWHAATLVAPCINT